MTTIELITKAELRNILMNVNNQTFISLVSVTEPDLKAKDANKSPNPFMLGMKLADGFDLAKINKASGTIDYEFDRMVRNRNKAAIIKERAEANLPPLDPQTLEAEADARHRKGSSWYTWLMKADGTRSCLAVNKKATDESELYLGFVYRAKGTAEYFTLNGEAVATDRIAPFFKAQTSYENQGLAEGEEVIVVTFSLDSILEIAVNGKRYRLLDTLGAMSQTLRNNAWGIAEQYLSKELRMRNVNG